MRRELERIEIPGEHDARERTWAVLRAAHADREPIATHATGPITLTDHVRAYEIIGGTGWHQLIAVDIVKGGGVWKADLGPEPVTAGGVEPGRVWIQQGSTRRTFDAATGTATPDPKPVN